MKVLVLGTRGMLGSIVFEWLSRETAFTVKGTSRDGSSNTTKLDAEATTLDELSSLMGGFDYVVNCIGVIKPYIHDDNRIETERAIRVNALFPHRLAEAAQAASCHVLQIATDCVYSGAKGNYQEPDPHDALDVYGKSKSLGEVKSEYMHHIRCSIIGPEPYTKVSLLEWFRGQAKSATVKGFTNHEWNGVTTLEFAKVCHGIIKSRMDVPGLHHLVPGSRITKGDLLECFAAAFNREDIRIEKAPAASVIDRTLTTRDEALNRKLWQSAGYVQPPSIPEMVDNLAKFVQPAVLT